MSALVCGLACVCVCVCVFVLRNFLTALLACLLAATDFPQPGGGAHRARREGQERVPIAVEGSLGG